MLTTELRFNLSLKFRNLRLRLRLGLFVLPSRYETPPPWSVWGGIMGLLQRWQVVQLALTPPTLSFHTHFDRDVR